MRQLQPPAALRLDTEAAGPQVRWADPARAAAFDRWLRAAAAVQAVDPATLALASADASFRRYLRVAGSGAGGGSFIVMDAPPQHEDVRPFVRVAALLADAGLHVPRVLHADVDHGFLLITDLGSVNYLPALQNAARPDADRLMRDALHALVRLQSGVPAAALPLFDAALLQRELDLFADWCVQRECGVTWTEAQKADWQRMCGLLLRSALGQPTVAVHADYMPRNLMVCSARDGGGGDDFANLGILDFQDAVAGPITYDLASLLRDAFVSWDEAQELDWAVRWWQQARAAGLPVDADFGAFWRALEWMGVQRHLKVLGIFCRLKHRDGKPQYAADLPRFFGYVARAAGRYALLEPLLALAEQCRQAHADANAAGLRAGG